MYDRRNFVKKGLLNAIGKQADFWVILNADDYAEKGVLTDDDLAEINAKIEAQYTVEEV